MNVPQRQVPPHIADVALLAEEVPHHGFGLSTVRTLEVPVLHHRHHRALGPADAVVPPVDGHGQVRQWVDVAQQRPRPASLRQQADHRGHRPTGQERADQRDQDADPRLLEFRAVERQGRDEQRHGERRPGDRAADGHRPQPTFGRSRPPDSRRAAAIDPTVPITLPTTQPRTMPRVTGR